VPRESGLHLRFALPYLDRDRFIPSIAHPFFLDRYPDEREGKESQERVGLFSGCSINFLFPSIGESTVRLLTRHRFAVALPKDQACCGLPAFGSGDLETARALARRNLKAFQHLNLKRILVPCASCFYFLKEGYLKLFPGDEEVRRWTERIVEPSVFFSKETDLLRSPDHPADPEKKIRITYHDPCHLKREMKIYQEPRSLLRSMPDIDLIEMKQPNRCCGMGGSFNLVYYDLSKKILRHKLDDIASTRADAVVTSCMGCMIQLKDGLRQSKANTKVLHLMEVLERSF